MFLQLLPIEVSQLCKPKRINMGNGRVILECEEKKIYPFTDRKMVRTMKTNRLCELFGGNTTETKLRTSLGSVFLTIFLRNED